MITFIQTTTETFYVVSCYTCGASFGIGHQLYKRAVTDAVDSVYCPACGKESCWRESEDSRRIKQLEQKLQWESGEVSRQKHEKEKAQASLAATKGVVTKLSKRAAAGVCPCCNRTFKQLARHMSQKHPQFRKST